MHTTLFGLLLAALVAVGLWIYVDHSGEKISKRCSDALQLASKTLYRELDLVRSDIARLSRAVLSSPVGMMPSVGRIVHYCLPDGRSAGELRPAIIVRIWPDPDGEIGPQSLCQLQVFMDGGGPEASNDGAPNVQWRTSVHQGLEPGTWRDPRLARLATPAATAQTPS